jgi:hypothetical protein
VNQGKRRLNQSLRFVRVAPPTNTGEFGVVALLDERDNLNRPRTSSLELSELLKRWGRGGGLGFGGYGYPDAYGYYDDEDDGGCYLVRRRVMTRYGWRIRRVQVSG